MMLVGCRAFGGEYKRRVPALPTGRSGSVWSLSTQMNVKDLTLAGGKTISFKRPANGLRNKKECDGCEVKEKEREGREKEKSIGYGTGIMSFYTFMICHHPIY